MMGRGSWGNLTMPGIWDLDDDDKAETLYPIPLGCWPQAQSAKSGFHQKLFVLIAFLIITVMRYLHHCHQTHHHWKSPVDHHWEDRWAPQAVCWADPLETQRSEGPASDDISPTYHTIVHWWWWRWKWRCNHCWLSVSTQSKRTYLYPKHCQPQKLPLLPQGLWSFQTSPEMAAGAPACLCWKLSKYIVIVSFNFDLFLLWLCSYFAKFIFCCLQGWQSFCVRLELGRWQNLTCPEQSGFTES